ncbi:hypothetical protein [Microbacterium gorillae]|uniref:hypothetical protein n=1 Tax=Microbacterium gorillae TaxID=1231063 RepID=UPI00058FE0E9|nr:hypothetical protein [Microbacterium gorillae]
MRHSVRAVSALVLALALPSLAACGASDTPTAGGTHVAGAEESTPTPTPTPEPLTLVGEWKSTNTAEDSWQAASITADTITIDWVSDGGGTKALYWAGTYVPPTEATDAHTWESANDVSQTEHAILASSDPTKTFTYADGVLSYEVTALGVTKTITMERVD